jgi:hypothetical protein
MAALYRLLRAGHSLPNFVQITGCKRESGHRPLSARGKAVNMLL